MLNEPQILKLVQGNNSAAESLQTPPFIISPSLFLSNTVGKITTFNLGSLVMGIFISQYFIPTTWTANLSSLNIVIAEVYTVLVSHPQN